VNDDTYALLAKVAAQLHAHIDSEETVLARIEKCLDGNGQMGLVRSHISHDERLRAIETWRVETTVTRRWLIALLVATAVSVAGTILSLLRLE
jgi:hypothetical protein